MSHPAADFLPLPHLPFHVLLALADGEPRHGWAVIKRIDEMTEGGTCPSTGSLYLAMGRLEDRGLLERVDPPAEEQDTRRKFYRLTALGGRVLDAESRRLGALVDVARASRLLRPER